MTDDLPDYIRGVRVNVHVSVEVPELVNEVEITINDIYDDVSAEAQVKLDELRLIMDDILLATPPDLQIYVADAIAKINEIYPLVSAAIGLKLDEIKVNLSKVVVEATPELATPTHFYPGKTVGYDEVTDPVTPAGTSLTVAKDLGRNGHDGYITNDDDDYFEVRIEDPDESWGSWHKLKKDEIMDLAMLNIKEIEVKAAAGRDYRALVV